MTSKVTIKSPKMSEKHSRKLVDIKEVPDLIARVMQNDLFDDSLLCNEVKSHGQPNH